MNSLDERSRSCWMDEGEIDDDGVLDVDLDCDVLIVGGGIAGLSTAYELQQRGRSVVVIDRGAIGGGMTSRTTAHLASALDDFYTELVAVHGEDDARHYFRSQAAAIDRIEAICRAEAPAADFARVDGYLFPAIPEDDAALEDEYRQCERLGIPVTWAESAPIEGFDTGRAIRFAAQGRIHPARYMAALASAVRRGGGRLFSATAYVSDHEHDGHVEILTERGRAIRAEVAVFATNSPVNDRVAIHTKQMPMRTYAIAGRVPSGSVVDALYWDTLEAYHYVRLQPLSAGEDLLIVGGEDHRTGEATDMDVRFGALERWTRERFPSLRDVEYRWSGQVLEPIDFMPFCGKNPGGDRVYIHSGDSGQGITNGVAGAMTLASLITGIEAPFAPIFDPSRKPVTARPSLSAFIEGQLGAAKNFAEYFTSGEIASADDLAPGDGAIVREGLKKLALYRTPDGKLLRRSAICTHAGCLVHWNRLETCWDCPCHGSQFAPDGSVLSGPATKALGDPDA
jgi:hypothetical protein